MKKLAIITTHPIQYNAPFFKLLTERGKIYPKIFYTWPQAINGFEDPHFGKKVKWDIPLLDGYDWEAVENIAKYPSSKSWRGIDCPDLNKKIEIFSPDAVMIYGWNLKSHFSAMRYFKGSIPVWFFGDSTLLDERPGLRKLLRRMWLRQVYRYVDKAFYVGSNNRKYFMAHGLNEMQLEFFPHAIDNDRFKDNPDRKYKYKAEKLRAKLGYSDTDVVLLFAGKFEPRKNLRSLIEAVLKILAKKDIPLKLLMVGSGPEEAGLRESSIENPNIRFIPFQNQGDMPVIYRVADIYCLPSKSETWGLAVNEAMACGRPVLVSNKVGSSIDLIEVGRTGAIFNANQIHDLEEKLLTLVQSDLVNLSRIVEGKISNWTFRVKCEALERTI